MITVTPKAAEELEALLERAKLADPQNAFDDVMLRLFTTDDGKLAIAPDTPLEGDQMIEHRGTNVLLVGWELSETVENLLIDCVETEQGRKLRISRIAQKASHDKE
jgi:Fe-S cluster assembly iron-binding protein IscA